jgi:serine/threonine protein phosphatase 1
LSLIYAIGDVHGCYDQLLVAVAKIKAHAKTDSYRVFFLGDYVDRGPKSREVVNLVHGLVTGKDTLGKWFALRGNHEVMMLDALTGHDHLDNWRLNGGDNTRESYRGREAEMMEHAGWLCSLPTMLPTVHHCFVHAGVSVRYPLEEQPEDVLLWIRGWEKGDHDFGKHIVYGHTPKARPELRQFSTGLDTGAYMGGPLSVGVFDGDLASGPVDILEAR